MIPGVGKDQEALLLSVKRPVMFVQPVAFDKGRQHPSWCIDRYCILPVLFWTRFIDTMIYTLVPWKIWCRIKTIQKQLLKKVIYKSLTNSFMWQALWLCDKHCGYVTSIVVMWQTLWLCDKHCGYVTAVLVWLNYKNAYEYWNEQRLALNKEVQAATQQVMDRLPPLLTPSTAGIQPANQPQPSTLFLQLTVEDLGICLPMNSFSKVRHTGLVIAQDLILY